MTGEIPAMIALLVAVVLVLVLLPVLGGISVITGLVVLRSLTDTGAASTGSVLPSSTLSAVIAGAAIAVALVPSKARYGPKAASLWMFLLGAVLIWTIVGLEIFGADLYMLKESLRLASIMALFFSVLRVGAALSSKQISRLIATVVVPTAGLLVLGALFSVPAFTQGSGRAAGTFSHANAAGAFMSVAALVSLAFFWFQRSKLALFCGAVSVVSLLLTQSLGGFLGLGLGVLTLLIFNVRLSWTRKLLVSAAIGAVGFALVAFTDLGERFAELQGFDASTAIATGTSSDSLEWRIINWQLLLQRWSERPWFGYGLGSTGSQIMPLAAPPHSLPVQLLVETGIVGSGIIALLFLWGTSRLLQKARSGRWEATVGLAILVLIVVNGSESNLLDYTAADYLLVFFFAIISSRLVSSPMKQLDETELSLRIGRPLNASAMI
jgi:O-antigen ligase